MATNNAGHAYSLETGIPAGIVPRKIEWNKTIGALKIAIELQNLFSSFPRKLLGTNQWQFFSGNVDPRITFNSPSFNLITL